jgi:hypothetical protein
MVDKNTSRKIKQMINIINSKHILKSKVGNIDKNNKAMIIIQRIMTRKSHNMRKKRPQQIKNKLQSQPKNTHRNKNRHKYRMLFPSQ